MHGSPNYVLVSNTYYAGKHPFSSLSSKPANQHGLDTQGSKDHHPLPNPQGEFPLNLIGGAPAGLTLSVGFSRVGVKYKIYEAAHTFSEVGARIASIEALRQVDPRIRSETPVIVGYTHK